MLVIKNGLVLKGMDLIPEKIDLLIDSNEIVEMGDVDSSNCEIIDAQGSIVLPSFNNAHVHIGDSIAKDVGDGKTIDELVKPPNGLKHKILEGSSREDLKKSIRSSLIEMINNGITSFIDYREGGLDGIKLLKESSENLAIKPIILSRDKIFHDDDASSNKIRSTVRKLLKESDGIGLSGFGEISDETAKIITNECYNKGKISSIHVAEHLKAQKKSLEKTNKTEIQRAIDANFKQIVHLTNPLGNDIEYISKLNNSNINSPVLCPRSNGTLSVGIPPINELLKINIEPLLGTDNLMFNSPDMFREMEYALKVSRGFSKEYISPADILKMSTVYFNKFINNNLKEKAELNNKSSSNCIEIGSKVNLIIIKQISSNPYLSIINRGESKHIIKVINNN